MSWKNLTNSSPNSLPIIVSSVLLLLLVYLTQTSDGYEFELPLITGVDDIHANNVDFLQNCKKVAEIQSPLAQ
jgi:hypothetical protein